MDSIEYLTSILYIYIATRLVLVRLGFRNIEFVRFGTLGHGASTYEYSSTRIGGTIFEGNFSRSLPPHLRDVFDKYPDEIIFQNHISRALFKRTITIGVL